MTHNASTPRFLRTRMISSFGCLFFSSLFLITLRLSLSDALTLTCNGPIQAIADNTHNLTSEFANGAVENNFEQDRLAGAFAVGSDYVPNNSKRADATNVWKLTQIKLSIFTTLNTTTTGTIEIWDSANATDPTRGISATRLGVFGTWTSTAAGDVEFPDPIPFSTIDFDSSMNGGNDIYILENHIYWVAVVFPTNQTASSTRVVDNEDQNQNPNYGVGVVLRAEFYVSPLDPNQNNSFSERTVIMAVSGCQATLPSPTPSQSSSAARLLPAFMDLL